jgi:hypothetical protein
MMRDDIAELQEKELEGRGENAYLEALVQR